MKCLQEKKYFPKIERNFLGLDGDDSNNTTRAFLGLVWLVFEILKKSS
jgi:hypothetical protein